MTNVAEVAYVDHEHEPVKCCRLLVLGVVLDPYRMATPDGQRQLAEAINRAAAERCGERKGRVA